MVDIVLKIHRKMINFEYKNDQISKTKNWENGFFIRFSTFRIFHVNLAIFELKKKVKHFNHSAKKIIALFYINVFRHV